MQNEGYRKCGEEELSVKTAKLEPPGKDVLVDQYAGPAVTFAEVKEVV